MKFRIAASLRRCLRRAVATATLATASVAFAQPTGHQYVVNMGAMDFGALPAQLKVGDTIAWTNNDTVVHSVTARDNSFDLRINPHQSVRLTLTRPGKIPFYCRFHSTMRGALNVEP